MSEPAELPEADLDRQLRGLFKEAEQQIVGRTTSRNDGEKEVLRPAEERALRAYSSLPQMLRPMVLGLEAISRATGENSQILQRIDKAHLEANEAHQSLPRLISGLEALLDQKNTITQRMFDMLHEQLKDYKDDFLLESILKPILRDLISLYDDLATIHRQLQDFVEEAAANGGEAAFILQLRRMEMNLAHHCEFVLEILARLDVTMMPVGVGHLDKQTQRVVAIEAVTDPCLDRLVIKTLKRGFLWKERVLRPEEVIMNKWNGVPAASTLTHSVENR